MSTKFQITLPEDLAAELKETAARREVSLAQFIRETMEEKLKDLQESDASDPFSWMDGLADTTETDLAARVDEILYDDGKSIR